MLPAALRYDDSLRERTLANLEAFDRRPHHGAGLRPAAVALVLIADSENRPCFLITRRAADLSSHGGQWALPGGRIDAGESAKQAALRELDEEVGLALAPKCVLGLLDDYPTRSGYVITPVVMWAGPKRALVPNSAEVAAVYRVPLAELDRPDVPRLRHIPQSVRPVISVPLLGTYVHAPTAAIL